MKFKAILVNPQAQTVTEVEYDSGEFGDRGLESIYSHVGCDCVDIVRINNKGDAFFVDDEGLLHDREQWFFMYRGYGNPLAGNALLLGCDDEGDSVAPTVSREQIEKDIRWVTPVSINGKIVLMPA